MKQRASQYILLLLGSFKYPVEESFLHSFIEAQL